MENVNLLDKSLCTGCGLCNNVCPVGAIEMRPNAEGFIIPVINDACINCGLCAKKCPQLSKNYNLGNDAECYAVWSNSDLRAQGSSGGVFPALAEYAVDNGGIVYGAAFSQDYRALTHIGVEEKSNLPALYKSKYVQSNAEKSYTEVKKELECGRRVIYSGCPCQIDALKTYLGKDYDNLLTIDILCHGVPSPLAYERFLDEVSGGKVVTGVDFRDKAYGWGTLIRVDFEDGTSHYDQWNGNYFRAFLNGISMREACYHCPYARKERPGDLTIGDFWGIEKFKPDWNDKKGTSLVMCNTPKGIAAIDEISKKIKRKERIPLEKVVEISTKANGALVRPTHPHPMHKCFFYHLGRGDSFSKSLRYAEKALLDIGILGWWIETPYSNYGSTLTDYALYSYISSLGLSVAMVSPPNFDRQNAGYFNKKYKYRMTAKYTPEMMRENNKYIDGFVVASDVLWYYDAFIRQGYNFLLDFVDDSKRKISYSTSFGNAVRFFPEDEIPYAKYLMKRFDHVSVRELDGVELCKKHFDVTATQVLDPVFLCDMKDWRRIAGNAERKHDGKYIFAYVLDPNPQKAKALKSFAKKLGYDIVSITDKQTDRLKKEEILKGCGVLSGASIEEFIYHIMNAEFVVTDSFHGFCFSMIFNRPFYAVANKTRGRARFDTITRLIDVSDRLIEDFAELDSISVDEALAIDYSKINANIDRECDRSKKWLHNALFSEKRPPHIDEATITNKELYLSKKKITDLEAMVADLMERVKKLESK